MFIASYISQAGGNLRNSILVYLRAVALILLIQSFCTTQIFADILELSKEAERVPLAPYLEILEDPEKSFSIEEITSSQTISFTRNEKKVTPNFGYTQSAYWVKIPIQNLVHQSLNTPTAYTNYFYNKKCSTIR